MLDHARCGEVSDRIHETADDPRRVDRRRDHALRIDGFQVETFEVATVSLKVPPRNAVQSTHDGRVWRQCGGQLTRNRWEAVGLERHDHYVATTDRAQIIRRMGVDGEVLATCDHAKSLPLDSAQMWATRQEQDLLA